MKVLNFQERNEFLDEVVKACTIDGDYQPALLDVVFRLTVLKYFACLLYTSDAADEEDSGDLGGCRSIKKKKKNN